MALTPDQKNKLPVQLKIILERFHHDPRLLMELKRLLISAAQKVQQHSINHETFCDAFQIPKNLPNELLKLYGIPERELKQAMQKIGFVAVQRMYNYSYYQTLAIAYLVGLEFNDENLRKLALLLIEISIWNGRKKRSFPTWCDPDVARYVMNYVLRKHHTLKKIGGSAFDYIDKFSVPALDAKYSQTIPNNLDSPTEGLRKLIDTTHSRILQLFNSIKRAYYDTYREGKKEIISGQFAQQYGQGEMVEKKETFSGTIERLTDKIIKNAMLKRKILLSPDAKEQLKQKFNISDASLQKISEWFDDEDNQEEIKYFFELLFQRLKPANEADICKFEVPVLANMVTGAKKDENLQKAKQIIDHALQSILGTKFNTLGEQSKYRARNIIARGFIIYAKKMLCRNT